MTERLYKICLVLSTILNAILITCLCYESKFTEIRDYLSTMKSKINSTKDDTEYIRRNLNKG